MWVISARCYPSRKKSAPLFLLEADPDGRSQGGGRTTSSLAIHCQLNGRRQAARGEQAQRLLCAAPRTVVPVSL